MRTPLPKIRRRDEDPATWWQRMNARGVTPFEWCLLAIAGVLGTTEIVYQVALAAGRAAFNAAGGP